MTSFAPPDLVAIRVVPSNTPTRLVDAPSCLPMALLRGVVAHVQGLIEEGEIPLFVWTLGLPQAALGQMLEDCKLRSPLLDCMDSKGYTWLELLVPQSFHDLRLMLFQNRTRLIDSVHADYFSRVLAGACFGSQQLWQDMGLGNEDELASFMATFFSPLALRHKQCRHWKRQLLKNLHGLTKNGLSPPDLLLKCVQMRQ